ncbi:MAG: hypothetical protein DI538_06120 [Azospira oryzae]|nr:MAG: hypothetical protein DI538_06120 [Azospira oryzae]
MKSKWFVLLVLVVGIACNNTTKVVPASVRLEQDRATIKEYLATNNITAVEDSISGVHYVIKELGTGVKPTIYDCVMAKYKGTLMSDGTTFDENDTGYKLPLRNSIAGWQIAFPLFPVGTKATLYIPSGYAYGSGGSGTIPANSILIFDVELVNVYAYNTTGAYCYDDPVLPDPTAVENADYVVIESTYGNRIHDQVDPTEALGSVIERTTARGGTVVIPAFAVGRAQSLLYHLWKLRMNGRLGKIPIYLDSPMAIDATDLLHAHRSDHRLSPQECYAICSIATYTRDVEGSKAITASAYPKIVISASGMATGGRVLHHLKAFAPDSRNTILFSGFQAAGTRGRAMMQGSREIKIHGQWIPVRAEVADLSMLSAHADANELMRWLSGFRRPPSRVFIVHGEDDASEALRVRIDRELGWNAVVSRQNQAFDL